MNSLITLELYRHNQHWVFDDPSHKLVAEPFIAGIDKMLDHIAESIGEDEASHLIVTASNEPFPGWGFHLEWQSSEHGGNWYHETNLGMEGWLCPALYHYFDPAPTDLYVKVVAKDESSNTSKSKIKDAMKELEGMRADIIEHLLPSVERKQLWKASEKALTRGLYLRRVEALELAIKTLRGAMND